MMRFKLGVLLMAFTLLIGCSPFLDTSEHEFEAQDQGSDEVGDSDITDGDMEEVDQHLDQDVDPDSSVRPPLGEEPHVGFVYVGPVGDHGWTKTHDDSRLALEESIDSIETRFEPSVNPADAVEVMDGMIEAGANVVIGTSFDFLSAVQQAAANHPDVNFLITSGFVTSPNLGSYFGRMYQVLWLAGRLAAQTSRTGRIGVVGAVVIPETVRHLNAFTLGAQSIDPDIVVEVMWVQEWFNTTLEQEYTEALVAHGADIIYSGTDTPIAISVADGLTAVDDGPVLFNWA